MPVFRWRMWSFRVTDAGEQVGVEVGKGGISFQGASVFSVRQEVR